MAKKKTAHNTGLAIERNGNKFTAKWKIKAKNVTDQDIRYRTYNGKKWSGWTVKDLGKTTTSFNFWLSAGATITQVQAQTRAKAKDHTASDWKSSNAVFGVAPPANPSVTVENVSSNRTTFTISNNKSDTDAGWYYATYYRTRLGNGAWSSWAVAGTTSYSYTDNNSNGLTRSLQVINKGPAGWSGTSGASHYLGAPPIATWGINPVSKTDRGSYYQMTYNFNLSGSSLSIDKIVPQYFIGTPSSSIGVPDGASWQNGTDHSYKDGTTGYTMAITTSGMVEDDECCWARVKTEHDGIESFSAAYRVITGRLTKPACAISVGTITASGFSVTVNITDEGTDVPGAYQQVFLEKASAPGEANFVYLGAVPSGDTSVTLTSTIDLTAETGLGIYVRNVSADGKTMTSDYYSYKTSMPAAPTLDGVTPTTVSGKVHVDWTNQWNDATGTEIAWTEDRDNWTSNDEPETYEVKEKATGWYITGLETGKVWYFRIRSTKVSDEQTNYSPWSNEVEIDLASAPSIPVLYLSEETITEDGMVTAYWSYVTTDGTGQIAGEVVEATFDGSEWRYSDDPVGATTDAQHVDIYAADHWQNGATVYLALRTRSGSGGTSDYSTPVRLVIAAKPTVAITSTGLSGSNEVTETFRGDGETTAFLCEYSPSASPTVTVDGATASASYSGDTVTLASAPADGAEIVVTYTTTDFYALTTMPLSVEVTAGSAETVTLAIERAVDYPLLRPDGQTTQGPAGETVFLETVSAEATNTFSVELDDLIGRLDDGADYTIVATATDEFGQTAEETMRFTVKWTHQAEEPTGQFITDSTNYIARITPIAPSGYEQGDTCDIYRLSADGFELIYQGATFGTEYVDPYPAFGETSGYKLVTVTAMNDYITPDNSFAELDTSEADPPIYDQLDQASIVIDFGGERVELPYNISLDNSWTKDFERTQYLGGSVVGDYNAAVLRDLSASTVMVRGLDAETAAKMRSLSSYADVCHVRTPDGSSFAADVQVSETQSFDTPVISYSLKIQKIDTAGFDGMTYAEWLRLQENE